MEWVAVAGDCWILEHKSLDVYRSDSDFTGSRMSQKDVLENLAQTRTADFEKSVSIPCIDSLILATTTW